MKKSLKTFLNRSIVVLLLLVVLLTSVSSAIKAYALAQPVEPISQLAPVFDTQIYQLTDYVQESLTEPQLGIFYLLLGAWVVAQGGTNDYKLEDPYTTSDGVRGWLKSTGIQLYNSMLDLVGGKIYDTLTGTDMTPYLSMAIGYALGAAKTAKKYTDETDFVDHVNAEEHYFVPFDPLLQQSINAYFGRKGGLWNWQFDELPFLTDKTPYRYFTPTNLQEQNIQSSIDALNAKAVRGNPMSSSGYNGYIVSSYFDTYNNLFINTSTNKFILVNDSGDYYGSTRSLNVRYFANQNSTSVSTWIESHVYPGMRSGTTFNAQNYNTYVDLVRDIFNNSSIASSDFNNNAAYYLFYSDFVQHVYVGNNWATKQEIFNITDLNFAQSNEPQEYYPVPENTYLDIKGLLVDLINNTDLLRIIFDNLFNDDGTLNISLPDIQVSVSLPDTNPLPVNLNEIEVYTHNEYLDTIKKYSYDFADTIGEYVAFWHNADYETVYALLGSVIIIIIGAFIGKWGHS